MTAAGPAVAVAVNVTDCGIVVIPTTVAVIVCEPAVVPSVQSVAAAPATFVAFEVGATEPLPLAGAQLIVTPASAAPLEFFTDTI
jgi:hypothetical protein